MEKQGLIFKAILSLFLSYFLLFGVFLTHPQCKSRGVSVLEREEMDRLLNNAKSELFSEQRRFRDTLDSMQEVHLMS